MQERDGGTQRVQRPRGHDMGRQTKNGYMSMYYVLSTTTDSPLQAVDVCSMWVIDLSFLGGRGYINVYNKGWSSQKASQFRLFCG